MMFAPAVLLTGCASDGCGSRIQPALQPQAGADGALAVGLDREQVRELGGKPDKVRLGAGRETWVYNLSRDEVFIPWNLSRDQQVRTVDFDSAGKVKSWSSNN